MLALVFAALPLLGATDLIQGTFESKLVPRPVEYAVLLPDGYNKAGEPLPFFLLLHGGGGDRKFLAQMRPAIEELWRDGRLSKMIFATPSVSPRCFYMDYKDGSEKWETLLVGAFREHIQETYNTSRDVRKNFVGGISMGGMGSVRMGFKHPEKFGAIMAMEPGVEPILKWSEMQPRHRFWRADDLFWAAFGKPVDAEYWEANNPAAIVKKDAKRIIASGLQIYLEVGDEDMFLLHEGTEFLHRVLWDAGVKHEYHLVRGADHVGRTVGPRFREGMQFIERVLNPPAPDPAVERTRELIIYPAMKKAGLKQ